MKKPSFSFLLALLLLPTICAFIPYKTNAQEEIIPPPAKRITSFPFTMLTGGIIVLKVTLDAKPDTLNFILDTGSGGISIDSVTCLQLQWKTQMSNRIIRGIAGMKRVEFSYGHTLNLPGLSVDSLDFHINDYDILTSVYGVKIDGIIGYSFLSKYIVNIDYDNSLVHVYTQGTYKYPRGGYLLHPQFSTLVMQPAMVKDATTINGRFYFDTGAGLCMLLSQDFVDDSVLLKKKKKIFLTEAEGLGGKREMQLTVIKELKVGPYRFRRVPIYIFEDDFNVTSYPILGGLLGNDILRRFNVTLNYREQQIYIDPNKHYNDSFDYSYTGLGIYMVDGLVTVVDIMKNSPAEKAGFQPDDIIVAIDNNFSNNIQTYKTMLQNAKARLSVLILRNNEPKILKLKVKSIF